MGGERKERVHGEVGKKGGKAEGGQGEEYSGGRN